jgi:hypothetical protein
MKTGASLATCTERELLRVKRDNFATQQFSISTDTYEVCLTGKILGGFRDETIAIPRNVFNKLIKQYQKQQRFIRKAL